MTELILNKVTELIQGLVDHDGGSLLRLGAYTPLTPIIGDPCPGYPKDLRIQYEICGRSGSVVFSEVRGHLRKRLLIQVAPVVAPLIFVQSATYGITPTSRRVMLDKIALQIARIIALEHK